MDKMIEEECRKGFMVIELIVSKLRIHLQLSQSTRPPGGFKFEGLKTNAVVPKDVEEGHFAVFALKTEKPRRFVVELRFLTNPAFLRLLKQAEEEYGFKQEGVLAVPCQREGLQKILHGKVGKKAAAGNYKTNHHQN